MKNLRPHYNLNEDDYRILANLNYITRVFDWRYRQHELNSPIILSMPENHQQIGAAFAKHPHAVPGKGVRALPNVIPLSNAPRMPAY